MELLLKLFITFIKIGSFSFGGGYVMIPLIQNEVVELNQWISETAFIDMIAISQSTPGPIAVNTATYVGYEVMGFWGALVGTLAVTIISFLFVLIVSLKMEDLKNKDSVTRFFYGLRPAVVAMILGVTYKLGSVAIVDKWSVAICVGVILLVGKMKVHPIVSIVLSGLAGIVIYQ